MRMPGVCRGAGVASRVPRCVIAAGLGRRFAPALPGQWLPAIVAGAIAAAAFLPWVWVYPAVLGGPAGVFSPEARGRIWNHISEMRALSTKNAEEIRTAVEDGKQRLARLTQEAAALPAQHA